MEARRRRADVRRLLRGGRIRRRHQRRAAHTVGTPLQHQRADRLHLGASFRRRPGGQQRRRFLPHAVGRGTSAVVLLDGAGGVLPDLPLHADAQDPRRGGGTLSDNLITFANVSRFYGEVLGVNKVSLSIPSGVTSLVGPNGSGKTTLMNLMTGLIRPSQGEISVLGMSTEDPEHLCRAVGYCAQFDTYPKGLTGYQFIYSFLRVFGMSHEECDRRTMAALETVGLTEARNRQVAAYSKGMRQRVKLAQATAHDPQVVILDEPLNGLDPLARAEAIALFEQWGAKGRHVIVSSHILHEVDRISDQVILLSQGYVVAEGQIHSVRSEVQQQPMQLLVRYAH